MSNHDATWAKGNKHNKIKSMQGKTKKFKWEFKFHHKIHPVSLPYGSPPSPFPLIVPPPPLPTDVWQAVLCSWRKLCGVAFGPLFGYPVVLGSVGCVLGGDASYQRISCRRTSTCFFRLKTIISFVSNPSKQVSMCKEHTFGCVSN